jgi:hypothetical protein
MNQNFVVDHNRPSAGIEAVQELDLEDFPLVSYLVLEGPQVAFVGPIEKLAHIRQLEGKLVNLTRGNRKRNVLEMM